MSDDTESFSVDFELEEKPKQKGKKPKKRPSDFEIARTLLTRTTVRKLPFILKNMGEDKDIIMLCSEKEEDFRYGSSELTIALFEFTDPELKAVIDTVLEKLYGFDSKYQIVINLRDQVSELFKTKGETMEVEVFKTPEGTTWFDRTDKAGITRSQYLSYAVESLYHFEMVKSWCKQYRPLLATTQEDYLFHPHTFASDGTYDVLTIPPCANTSHPIAQLYPNGFRTVVTKGIDVLVSKDVMTDFPYPLEKEEIIVFRGEGTACQLAHRLTGTGWRAVVLRPNSVLFPTLATPIPDIGNHLL